MRIPFVDLKTQYEALKPEIDDAIQDTILSSAFIGGKKVREFEEAFGAFLGVGQVVGVGNGTDALYVTLRALGLGAGDEVLVPALTFIATSEAVSMTGARPVFVDVRDDDYLIDLDNARQLISPRTRAIIPVHLYGQPADMRGVMQLAEEANLNVIEDAAQAHGAKFGMKNAGTIGTAGCFSFYPGKNLGAYGDAGAIVTSDPNLAECVRMLANHGRVEKYDHRIEGVNSRLDGLQAAILRVKLRHLSDWTASRQKNADLYTSRLADIPQISTPRIHPDRTHVFHLYVIRAQRRGELIEFLKERGISTGIHYPIACPFLGAYASRAYVPADFPVAAGLTQEIISLPMFPELTEEQIDAVTRALRDFYAA